MIRNRTAKLKVETFEERIVPVTGGIPWLGHHITLSFAPDGAQAMTAKSDLNASMAAAGLSTAQWQGEILRAFQTWASQANLDISVVRDSGAPEASAGLIQGDPRFGDIRVFSQPIGANTLAITALPGYTAETRAGDIVLNSKYKFDIGGGAAGFDLYTTVLHEAGHSLGIPDNGTDLSSVEFQNYMGVSTGLGASDIAAIQSLYGVRVGGTATAPMPATAGTSTLYLAANLAAAGETDSYTFTVPAGNSDKGATVKLATAGDSLLKAQFGVFDSTGALVGTSSVTSPASGSPATLALPSLVAGATYTVQVYSADATYNVGSYELRTIFDASAADPGAKSPFDFLKQSYVDTGSSNGTMATATALPALAGTTAQQAYQALSVLPGDRSSADYYSITAPALAAGTTTTLTIALTSYTPASNSGDGGTSGSGTSSFGGYVVSPDVSVFDASGNPVAVQSIATEGSHRVYQILNVTAGAKYFLKVQSTGYVSSGNYELTAVYQPVAVKFTPVISSTLSSAASTTFGTLTIASSQVLAISLSAGPASGIASGLTITIYDASRKIVFAGLVPAGTSKNFSIFLATGQYTVKIAEYNLFGSLAPMKVSMSLMTMTHPMDINPSDPLGLLPPDGGLPPVIDLTTLAPPDFSWDIFDPFFYIGF